MILPVEPSQQPDLQFRVAVTGLGAVTAAGKNLEQSWQSLLTGQTSIRPFEAWKHPYAVKLAGQIKDFNPLDHFAPHEARRLDRCQQLAIVASRQAIQDSTLRLETLDLNEFGISLGTSLGGMLSGQRYNCQSVKGERPNWTLLWRYPLHVCVDELSREFGLLGPRYLVSTACTSSTVAIASAVNMLRSGQARFVLAGGVDPLVEFSFAGFSSMNNLSPVPCAPFSQPMGMSLGEGAGMLVLEPMDQALVRGAHIYAELLGFGLSADACHPTSPDPTGKSQIVLLKVALESSGVTPDEVDYINAHGTGTQMNDFVESRSVEMAFSGHVPPVTSLKGALGHTMGACGALEAVFTIMSVDRDMLPPTANYQESRRGCNLDYVPGQARPQNVSVAITQNFAFGGNNAALVFAKPLQKTPRISPTAPPRVVITGMGLLTPIGIGLESYRQALCNGTVGFRNVEGLTQGSHLAGVLPEFQAKQITRVDTRRLDRLGLLTVAAVEMAVKDAGLTVTRENMYRIGIVGGTTFGPVESCHQFHHEIALDQPNRCNPGTFPNTVFNACIGQAAIHLNLHGCNVMISQGATSGLLAILDAWEWIRSGSADVIIAGGVDELPSCLIDGFAHAQLASPRAGTGEEGCRPFATDHNGAILGEGAAFVVMETLQSAQARGATILAELLGGASTGDRAVRWNMDASGEGLARCMRKALKNAERQPGQIDYVGAAGFAIPDYDQKEAQATERVFGPYGVPVGALSSRVGVSAATPVITLTSALLGMQAGFMPPGARLSNLMDGLHLDMVHTEPRSVPLNTALINSMAFGGTNASLIVERFKLGAQDS